MNIIYIFTRIIYIYMYIFAGNFTWLLQMSYVLCMNCIYYIIHSFIDHLSSIVFSVHGFWVNRARFEKNEFWNSIWPAFYTRGVSSTLAKMPKQATVAAKPLWADHELYWGLMVWWLCIYIYIYLFNPIHELGESSFNQTL